jgi:hypothetical protein
MNQRTSNNAINTDAQKPAPGGFPAPVMASVMQVGAFPMYPRIYTFICVSAVMFAGVCASAETSCQSFSDVKGRSNVDFAPPNGFVEVCSRDAALCHRLSKGYPSTVQTIAYFVTAEDWAKYPLSVDRSGFKRYLIGQRTRGMTADEFLAFKSHVHSQQGSVADHTELPRMLESQGRMPLGIIDESEDSVSFGIIMKLGTKDNVLSSFYLSSVNVALQLKGETLALYAFDSSENPDDGTAVKFLARQWLACVRKHNS